uniref:Nucleoside diphosphate kinase-like domain-containing protein n=1 Tax=Sus scrofa TaxID=9823 RepID=A0A8D0YXT6_PIG
MCLCSFLFFCNLIRLGTRTVIPHHHAWYKASKQLFSKYNGKIIAKIKGANAPLVNQKVITLINEERKIAAGEMVRPQYHEVALVDSDSEDAGETGYENVDELYSIVIINPDAVNARKVLEIKDKIINTQFVIEAEDKRLLTAEQVRYFYSQKADEPDFEDFVSFMTSGLSYILVISQKKEKEPPQDESEANSETEARETWDDQQEMAKCVGMKHKQDSLQEYMRRQHLSQFCDVEENITNTTLIDIFFPDFKIMKGIKLEKILALLRPDLFHEKKEDVLNIIQDEGFKIMMQRQIVLSEEEAQTLCKEYENKDYFENLIKNMTSGPSLALVLLRDNCLMHWKQLIGPSTVEEAREHLPERYDAYHGSQTFLMGAILIFFFWIWGTGTTAVIQERFSKKLLFLLNKEQTAYDCKTSPMTT